MAMKSIQTREEALTARYELELFMIGTPRGYLGSGGKLLARIPPAALEWSVEWGRLILTWWDDEQSQRVRITGYGIERGRVVLLAVRGLTTAPMKLVIDREVEGQSPGLEAAPEELPARRLWYAERLAGLIDRWMPEVRIDGWSVGADQPRQVPGRYARLRLTRRGEKILALGVSAAEEHPTVDGLIAAGLIWQQSYNRDRSPERQARQLWFFPPRTRSLTVIERISFLRIGDGRISTSCFEVDEIRGEISEVRPVSQFELLSAGPQDLLWPEFPALVERLDRIGLEWHRRIIAMAPALIEPRYRPGRRLIGYTVHGLEFARLPIDDGHSAEFGVSGDPERMGRRGRHLTERSLPELHQLVRQLVTIRRAGSADRRHPFYRLRAEGWLESLLRRNIRALDPRLDPRFIYSQIPAWHADERSVIDLLGMVDDRVDSADRGRLVVIEIKAAEDPQLPLQGLDYWMRVEQARLQGEFRRRGLFAGARVADRSPLLYLVAPRLRFHRSFTTIARSLHPDVEGLRIGLNSNWRDGVQVRSFELLREL